MSLEAVQPLQRCEFHGRAIISTWLFKINLISSDMLYHESLKVIQTHLLLFGIHRKVPPRALFLQLPSGDPSPCELT